MFKRIGDELDGIRHEMINLGKWLELLCKTLREVSEGSTEGERVSALEGAVEAIRGEVAGGLVKAEALKAAARAAEDRERTHMKRAEAALELAKGVEGGEDVDPFEAAARAYADVVSEGDGEAVEPLSPVSHGVVSIDQSREIARAAKRGR